MAVADTRTVESALLTLSADAVRRCPTSWGDSQLRLSSSFHLHWQQHPRRTCPASHYPEPHQRHPHPHRRPHLLAHPGMARRPLLPGRRIRLPKETRTSLVASSVSLAVSAGSICPVEIRERQRRSDGGSVTVSRLGCSSSGMGTHLVETVQPGFHLKSICLDSGIIRRIQLHELDHLRARQTVESVGQTFADRLQPILTSINRLHCLLAILACNLHLSLLALCSGAHKPPSSAFI